MITLVVIREMIRFTSFSFIVFSSKFLMNGAIFSRLWLIMFKLQSVG